MRAKEKLQIVKDALTGYAASVAYDWAELTEMLSALENRPLIRWFVMRKIEDEMKAAGVNWEAIGDFIVKIAPVIFEILKMFI